MAYIKNKNNEQFADSSSITPKLPSHVSDDILVCVLQQDNGLTAIATVTSGWANVGGQARSGSSRQVIFWKRAVSSSEANPVFTGTNETWLSSSISLGDVDTTTAIDGSNRTDWNAVGVINSPALTTTVDDCLLLYTIGSDNQFNMQLGDPLDLRYIHKNKYTLGSGNTQCVGCRQQYTLGAIPTVTWRNEVSNEGGNAFVVAFRNKSGGTRQPAPKDTHDKPERFGRLYTGTSTDPNLIVSSINGKTVTSNTLAILNTGTFSDEFWNTSTSFNVNIASADSFFGRNYPITSYDFTNKNASITFEVINIQPSRYGDEGLIIALVDSSGNWVAHQMISKAKTENSKTYTFHFTPDSDNNYDSSGVLDLTDITSAIILTHRIGSVTSGQTVKVSNLIAKGNLLVVGGGQNSAISPSDLTEFNNSWGSFQQSSNQASGQGVSRSAIQFGDGSIETWVDFSKTSYELEERNTFNRMDDNTLNITVFASVNDSMIFDSCVIATFHPQEFIIHASSSTSATYSFVGANIIGWTISWLSGITCNQANISDCTIAQNGGTFLKCNIINSPTIATDLTEMNDCAFTSGGSGHAVELTSVGAGSFTWNCTDSGYAATDGSTGDETIYVNVGSGNLTINVSSGASTPTIRTAGAVVTVVVNPVTLKIIAADSDGNSITTLDVNVRVTADSGGPLTIGTEIINGFTDISGEIENTQALASNQPITGWARKSSSSPFYKQSNISGIFDSNSGLVVNLLMISDE